MARSTHEHTLSNGDRIRVKRWGARQAHDLMFDLDAMRAGDRKAWASIRDALIPCTELISVVQNDKAAADLALPLAPSFDDYFAGELHLLAEWIEFGIKVNYETFLNAVNKSKSPKID